MNEPKPIPWIRELYLSEDKAIIEVAEQNFRDLIIAIADIGLRRLNALHTSLTESKTHANVDTH